MAVDARKSGTSDALLGALSFVFIVLGLTWMLAQMLDWAWDFVSGVF